MPRAFRAYFELEVHDVAYELALRLAWLCGAKIKRLRCSDSTPTTAACIKQPTVVRPRWRTRRCRPAGDRRLGTPSLEAAVAVVLQSNCDSRCPRRLNREGSLDSGL
jgi:hypothetical protein